MSKELEEMFNKVIKTNKPVIVASMYATGVHGSKIDVMMLLANLVHNLSNNGLSKTEILLAVETGLLSEDELEGKIDKLN